jgi:hypothetical protein
MLRGPCDFDSSRQQNNPWRGEKQKLLSVVCIKKLGMSRYKQL